MLYSVWIVNLRTSESFDDVVEAIDEHDAYFQGLSLGEEMYGFANAEVVDVQPIGVAPPPVSYFPGDGDDGF